MDMKRYKVTLKDGGYTPELEEQGQEFETTYEYVEAYDENDAWNIAQSEFMKEYYHFYDGSGRIVVDVVEVDAN